MQDLNYRRLPSCAVALRLLCDCCALRGVTTFGADGTSVNCAAMRRAISAGSASSARLLTDQPQVAQTLIKVLVRDRTVPTPGGQVRACSIPV